MLAVGGHATLAGTLQLVRLNNFNLQRGEVIPFLAYVFYDGDLGRTNYETNSVSGGLSVAF